MITEVWHDPAVETQRRVYNFLRVFQTLHQCPPTYREIAAGAGLSSPGHVRHHIEALQRAGLIVQQARYSARGLVTFRQP